MNILYYESNYLKHYGVKGMKWGVRRTREQIDSSKTANKLIISGHKGTPKDHIPYGIAEHVSENGTVDVRSFYDEYGRKAKDIHLSDHGYPKYHKFDNGKGHVDEYTWNEDGSIKSKTVRGLTNEEREENADIL